jgi:hypothetical protein
MAAANAAIASRNMPVLLTVTIAAGRPIDAPKVCKIPAAHARVKYAVGKAIFRAVVIGARLE